MAPPAKQPSCTSERLLGYWEPQSIQHANCALYSRYGVQGGGGDLPAFIIKEGEETDWHCDALELLRQLLGKREVENYLFNR